MWTFFKALVEFSTVLLLFFSFLFWILAPSPGVEPTPPVPEDKVSPLDRQGRPKKELFFFFFLK